MGTESFGIAVCRFTFPTAWALDEPGAYFQQVVLPRKQRKFNRTMWNLVHKQQPKISLKAGEQPPSGVAPDEAVARILDDATRGGVQLFNP